jgi:hypothetical protein
MSIVACVKVYDGIVIGAESMTMLLANAAVPGVPGMQHQPMPIKSYSNAQKIFRIADMNVGVLTYGGGNIGNRSMASFVHEFSQNERGLPPNADKTVQGVADRLLAHMRGYYDPAFGALPEPQRPVIGFYIAGYSVAPHQHLGSEWEFVLPQAQASTPARPGDAVGASWRGIGMPFTRLFFGVDPRADQILAGLGMTPAAITQFRQLAAVQLQSRVAFDGMPLEDAVGFCKFIIETTIGMATYEIGIPSCGGPVHIAVITPSSFRWVSEPRLPI